MKIGWYIVGGLGVVATGIAFALRRRSPLGAETVDQIPSSVLRVIEPELDDAEDRARKAGAKGKLEYVGAGMTGIVFCDTAGEAFKVARGRPFGMFQSSTLPMLAEEATWMKLAAQMPGTGRSIARGVRWDGRHGVLVRECVRGKVGGWKDSSKLRDLHDRIKAETLQYGWSAPEFKEDSYVFARGRGPVLVDASMAHRVGRALVKDTLDVINGRRTLRNHETYSDHGFALRMERGQTVPKSVADRLLQRLKALDARVELPKD